jgi:alpha-glucosidase
MWWRDGVLYQCYPRSFADSDGDGVGDLRGIRARLDHLEWLGIDGLWLNPTFPSPNRDWGFDVADFRGVHPELGTLEDLDALVADAGARGIRVLLDLVPNHTSDQHPWFRERPELYVWADGRDGGPPNNWISDFDGPSWTYHEERGQWYLHNFLRHQPDLDWWNEEVRAEFDAILRFWFDRGIAGFRIDVAHGIVKDRALRDNPPAEPGDPVHTRRVGQRRIFSQNRPEVHDVHRRWRALSDAREDRPVLLGETWVETLEDWVRFYGTGDDELHLAFNFVLADLEEADAEAMADVVARTEAVLPGEAWPAWAMSNHDMPRFPTRWAHGDPGLVRCLLLALLTLRGTPVLYYGDELGMPEADVPEERRLDPTPLRRDGARTPMVWADEPGHGFTEAGVEPWLPFGAGTVSVAAQREDPGSHLHLVRDLIALRRARPDLVRSGYAPLPAPGGVWAFRRGDGVLVAVNLGAEAAELDAAGRVLLGTDRARDGEALEGVLRLAPRSGAVVELA